MILDLPRFVEDERERWDELERMLASLEDDPGAERDVAFLSRLHLLYERAGADLVKVRTFASEPDLNRYLESLLARAYGEIHEGRRRGSRFRPGRLLFGDAPRAIRRHGRALLLAVALTLAGSALGALALAFDPSARQVLMPFPHLLDDPAERVRKEEAASGTVEGRGASARATFSSFLVTHNVRVAVVAFALGGTAGVGTVTLLFYNGALVGAVAFDYIRAGETRFLLGWLLPHGSVEIPAFLFAGQAGLVLAAALLGWGDRTSLRRRLAAILPDLVAILSLVAVLLAWAAFVESFLSQHHEPALPYELKIGLGLLEAALLATFLLRAGRGEEPR